MKTLPYSFCLFLLVGAFSCGDAENDLGPSLDAYESTYDLIQGEIWDRDCISCHVAGSSFATQSELVLTGDVSYEQLINRAPNNRAAAEDGLLLVGDLGIESLHKSFLWEKINAPDQEHFFSDHPGYGSLMPLGGEFLTNGELEFIRKWIIAGAPEEGKVAEIDLLRDTTRFRELPFQPLARPESGYQFHVEPFEVWPNRDREIFIYEELNNPEPLYIKKIEIAMAKGSHHFILYDFDESLADNLRPRAGVLRDIYDERGVFNYNTLITMQYHRFVQGTQWPNTSYQFPEGVALKMPANTGFDLNSHYANRTDDVIMGEVYANIHTVPPSEVEHVAEILWLSNEDIRLPARQTTTLTKDFRFNDDRKVFQLWSHAHEHMTEFRVFIDGGSRDGELIYYTNDWEHPPILQLDPPLEMTAGTGFTLEATYQNDKDRVVGFGLLSTDEMMMLFGAYY